MAKPVLSKSTYIRSLQCLKSLYLYKFHYEQRDKISREQLATFNRGHNVGKLAHQLFPGGVDASVSAKLKSMQAQLKTYELIQSDTKIIYEASFIYDDVWVIADILEKTEAGWKVYEVKSSASLSETYMNDAALQYYVINNSMIQLTAQPLADFSLVYVNKNYVRDEKIDVRKMFLISNVKPYCEEQQPFVISKIQKAKDVLENGKVPPVDAGDHCFTPYPCDFTGTCWRNKTLPQLLSPTLNSEKAKEYFQSNRNYFLLELLKHKSAVPIFNKTRPYQGLIFSFSVANISEGKSSISNFTAESGADPNLILIPQLLKQLNNPVPVIVTDYNSKVKLIEELAENYPVYKEALQMLIQRLVNVFDFFETSENNNQTLDFLLKCIDLKKPFVKAPVFDAVSASAAFVDMQSQNDLFKNPEINENILAYSNSLITQIKLAVDKISS